MKFRVFRGSWVSTNDNPNLGQSRNKINLSGKEARLSLEHIIFLLERYPERERFLKPKPQFRRGR